MRTCFFTGHADAPLDLQERLNAVVERLAGKRDAADFW